MTAKLEEIYNQADININIANEEVYMTRKLDLDFFEE